MSRKARLRNRNQNRSEVVACDGMICASQPLASVAGIATLRAGGNAVDAAIAANAMLGLVEPMMCGLGGDLFAIVWSEREGRLFGLNASGRSPFDWSIDDARSLGVDRIPSYDALAWTVPGCVSGWSALLDRFGTKPLADLLAPTIAYAREGFPVSPIIARDWVIDEEASPTLARTYFVNGRAPKSGEIFSNPDLARTLDILATEGGESFYRGEIAERIVSNSKEAGGRFSLRDFAEHSVDWIDPVSTNYRGYDVWELPPNGQGIAVLQMLNMLERFDIASVEPNSVEHLHLLIEAKKLAFEDRAVYYADVDYASVPVDWLISKAYGAERAKLIDPKRAATEIGAGQAPARSDTVYLTTADSEGNMVSLIQSIYHGWGSRIVPDGLGFALQNRGESFSLDPNHRNALAPHKRPFHTIIPAFVTKDERPVFSFGVMGGDFQPQGQVQVLMNLIDFGMSVQEAGEHPRVRHFGSAEPAGTPRDGGGTAEFERGFDAEVKRGLANLGHKLAERESVFGGYQGIWREENPRRYFGGSDPRKDGCAAGY